MSTTELYSKINYWLRALKGKNPAIIKNGKLEIFIFNFYAKNAVWIWSDDNNSTTYNT